MNDSPLYRLVIADDHPLFRGALREAVSGLIARVEIAEAGSFDARLAESRANGRIRGLGFSTYVEICAFKGSEPAKA